MSLFTIVSVAQEQADGFYDRLTEDAAKRNEARVREASRQSFKKMCTLLRSV